MSKGISPLIAGVLLIAFVLAVAAIISGWLTSMTRTETATIETGFTTTINCSKGIIDIVKVTCEANVPNEEIKVVINNVGSIKLEDFSLSGRITQGGIFTNATYELTLDPGGTGVLKYVFNNLTYNGTVEKIRVSSINCPSVWAESTTTGASCPT